jgi:hypothetical protein
MLSHLSTRAGRRARRQRAVAIAAISGPSPVDLNLAIVEEIEASGWRVRVGSLTLGWGFVSREAAEAYLINLKQIKDTKPDGA